jgi:hypothetical protein
MKKIIILCATTCALINTTTLSMLLTKRCARQLIKKNNPKQLCNKTVIIEFEHEKLLRLAMLENKRLKEENALLERKLESLSGVTIDLTDERIAMPGKTKDRDFGHGNMHHMNQE